VVFFAEEFGLSVVRRMTRDARTREEFGYWDGRDGSMSIYYLAMSKGRVLKKRSLRLVEDLIDRWPMLESDTVFGQEGKAVNILDAVQYVHVRV